MRKSKTYLLVTMAAFALAACVHSPGYEVCDTPNCGDPVDIKVE